jgi:predicted nucleic acid-binding OB-fold protein
MLLLFRKNKELNSFNNLTIIIFIIHEVRQILTHKLIKTQVIPTVT